LTTDHNTELTS